MRVGTERRIDAVEGMVAFGGIDDDAAVGDSDGLGRSIDAYDTRVLKLLMVVRLSLSALSGAIRVTSAV